MGGRTEKGNLERKRFCLFVLPTPPQSARPSVRLMHIRPLPGEGSEGQAGFISSRHRKEREPVWLAEKWTAGAAAERSNGTPPLLLFLW